ncbi:protein SRG1-like [Punica granatum]|uniref:Protein SRG1-like n=2 Tax=Punica granatum TaxID=22663 RepID=A0A6P8DKC8_PUNGR|nr:protein SRG1-like [Punica granatum]
MAAETQVAKLGTSLPVPWVQDLAKDKLGVVPEKYVRTEQDPLIIPDSASLPQVPVIDLQKLTSGDSVDSELQRLHHACKEWGFFQLINHGMSDSLLEDVKSGILEFFNLPMDEKKKFWQVPGELEGFGQAFVVSEQQKLEWADAFYMMTLPTYMRKPYLFPKLPQPFRDILETYSAETKNLAVKILHQMAKALGMEAKQINELFDEGCQGIRMNYYPPCPRPDLVMGLNPHSDADALTLLLQVNDIEGLQIRKDGMWVPVEPLPNAFVVNIGDLMEMVSNGIYRSIEHRGTVNALKERISVATFYSPNMDAEIGPAPSLVTPDSPALFRRISVAEHLKGYFSGELRGKAYLDTMRI